MKETFKRLLAGLPAGLEALDKKLSKTVKKRIAGYGCAALLLCLILWLLPPAQGPGGPAGDSGGPTDSIGSGVGDTSLRDAQVRLFTCDPEIYSIFVRMAVDYSHATGTQVIVHTTGEGQTCQEALMAAAQAGRMPTVFCMHSRQDMDTWLGRLYDLTGSPILDKLCSDSFALRAGGKTAAIAMDVEGYGLIYNAALLAKAGFTRSDIRSYADLETVSQMIAGKRLGFTVFSSPGFANGSDRGLAGQLLGAAGNEESLRQMWDLYLTSAGGDGQGLRHFQAGTAVFYGGGTWEYESVAKIGTQNLDILPLYTPDGGSMGYLAKLCWGIDKLAEQQDINAALAFMDWLVTATEDAPAPVDALGLLAPFRDAATYRNTLEKKLRSYMNSEGARVDWDISGGASGEKLRALGQALEAYSQDPGDEAWQQVQAALEMD